MTDAPNDNDARPVVGGARHDAHGQAAMLLVESLIHGLIARSIISVADAVEIIGIAVEVKKEIAADAGEHGETLTKSLAMLEAISVSLIADLPDGQRTDE